MPRAEKLLSTVVTTFHRRPTWLHILLQLVPHGMFMTFKHEISLGLDQSRVMIEFPTQPGSWISIKMEAQSWNKSITEDEIVVFPLQFFIFPWYNEGPISFRAF